MRFRLRGWHVPTRALALILTLLSAVSPLSGQATAGEAPGAAGQSTTTRPGAAPPTATLTAPSSVTAAVTPTVTATVPPTATATVTPVLPTPTVVTASATVPVTASAPASATVPGTAPAPVSSTGTASPTLRMVGTVSPTGTTLAGSTVTIVAPSPTSQPETWIRTGDMTAARSDTILTLLANGNVLAVSGRGPNETPFTTADLYDPRSRTWTATGPMTIDRYFPAVVLLPTGTVLVAGGHSLSTNSTLASAELYNPRTNTWTTTGSMATARAAPGVLLPTGNVLVAGGIDTSGQVLASAELYDPATGTWTTTRSMVATRFGHTITLLANGKVLVAGGCGTIASDGTCTTVLANAELYDPSTGTWAATGPMTSPRYGHTATLLLDGRVLVTGGCSSLPYQYGCSASLTSAELYDPNTGTWTATTPMATPRQSHTATLLRNGEVLVAGGEPGCCGNLANATAELYNPSTGTWTATGSLIMARSDQGATLLRTGQVLVAGGTSPVGPGGTTLSSAELYTPAALCPSGTTPTPTPQPGTWTATCSLTTARADHTATLFTTGPLRGQVLIAGGCASGNPCSDVLASAELYNPATGTFSATRSMNDARAEHTATLLPDGRVFVVGGFDSNRNPLGTAELYNPTTETWTLAARMQTARWHPLTALLPATPQHPDGQVLVMDGCRVTYSSTCDASTIVRTAELYDPATNTWSLAGTMNATHFIGTATLLPTGQVLIAGGCTTDTNGCGGATDAVEVYDPPTNTWLSKHALNKARYAATATLLPDGQVLVAGGGNPGGDPSTPASDELYDPSNDTWTLTSSLSVPRAYAAASLLPNGQVLVAGGTDASAEVYDPRTGLWATTRSMTTVRSNFTATLLHTGQVLAVGGCVGDCTGTSIQTAELYTPSPSDWSVTGSMSVGRQFPATVLLPNGTVLVAGGSGGADGPVYASAEVYNPNTGIFMPTGSMTTPRTNPTATLLPNGKVLIAGGTDSTGTVLASAELYDPRTGTFAPTGRMTTPRSDHTATVLSNGTVLIAGGCTGSPPCSPLASAELYDPTSGTFTRTGSMSAPRYLHTATLLPDGQVLVAGGVNACTSGCNGLTSAELYNPRSGTWTTTGSMATGRHNFTATLLQDGRVLVAGGSAGSSIVASAELYDPSTGTFTSTGSLATPRCCHTATLLQSGQVLIAGGSTCNGYCATADAEIYDPSTGTFAATGSMTTGRFYHTALLLHDGQVLAAGGSTCYAGCALNSAELYTPSGCVSPGGNLVCNPGFEATAPIWTGGVPLPQSGTNWLGFYLGSTGGPQTYLTQVTSPVHSGLLSARVQTVQGGTGAYYYQDLPSLPSSVSYALSFWVNPAAPAPGIQAVEVMYGWDRAVAGTTTGCVCISFSPEGTVLSAWGQSTSGPALSPGTWHNVTLLADTCAGTVEMAVDGVSMMKTAPGAVPRGEETLLVGQGDGVAPSTSQYYYDDFSLSTLSCASAAGASLAGGTIPWHPHHTVRFSDGLSASVDLADGHLDLQASDMSIPALGPTLVMNHTWDSLLAQAGITTTAGQGWVDALTPSMSGTRTGTVFYQDATGATWPFTYTGSLGASGPYTAYETTPGLPWQLITSTSGYTLSNILTSEVLRFDAQGRYLSDTDAYGNRNSLSYSASGPTAETNSGNGTPGSGRSLAFSYQSGLLHDVQSPLWQTKGASVPESQHVAYGYSGPQLTSLTWGAGTPDARTATFGYSGNELTGVTTPAQHTWSIGYDSQGRVSSITSPISGTLGQVGYTPAYTTTFRYQPGQTTVVEGAGTRDALTTTYTLDGLGQATAIQDGLGDTTHYRYDVDHDVLTTIDANNNTTTNAYAYVGPPGPSGLGSIGLVTQTVKPPIALDTFSYVGGGLTPVTLTYGYDPQSYDLLTSTTGAGGVNFYAYDGHHSVITTTELVDAQPIIRTGCPGLPVRGAPRAPVAPTSSVVPLLTCKVLYQWRGSVTHYDRYGERSAAIDGRGLGFRYTAAPVDVDPTTLNPQFIVNPTLEAAYTSHYAYTPQGDLESASTPPIVTTYPHHTASSTGPVTTSYGYDADGNRISMTSANGNALGGSLAASYTTTYGYDHLGRSVSTTQPVVRLWTGQITQPVETTGYDGNGNVVRQVDGNDDVTTSSYDPLGRLVATTDPVHGTTVMTYTATEKVATQDPQGNVTTYRYDPAGRLVRTTDPTGGTTQDGYDKVGNTTAITTGDASGPLQIETRQYDAWNQVIVDAIGGPGLTTPQTTYTAYDADGNVSAVQNPNGDVTSYTYDLADQQTSTDILPASGTQGSSEITDYDPAGNVALSTDFSGRTYQPTYDADNRIVSSTDTLTATTTITTQSGYDPDGNLLLQSASPAVPAALLAAGTATGDSSTETDAYNAADWTRKTTDNPVGPPLLSTADGYDGAGQQRTLTVPDPLAGAAPVSAADAANPDMVPVHSSPVTMTLNAEGLVTATTEGIAGPTLYTSTMAYNQDDLPVTSTVPGGVREIAQYDTSSRLTGLSVSGPGAAGAATTLGAGYGYGYDAANWTTAVTTTVGGRTTIQTTAHDALGRLHSVQGSDGSSQSWTYDANGNIETVVSGTLTSTYRYTSAQPNEVQTVSTPGRPTVSFGYDGNGDTTSITTTHGSSSIGYDSQGRPVIVTLSDGTRVLLSYDAQSRRSSYSVIPPRGTTKPSMSETFTYRGDQLGQVAVVSGTQSYTDTYLYNQDGSPLELLRAQNGTLSRYWYVLDGRGNVVALTSITGTVVDRYSYDLWGQPISVSERVPQRLRYAGYWWDQELGWYWVSVRYYDPALERWLQPDPSQQDGMRTYVYRDC